MSSAVVLLKDSSAARGVKSLGDYFLVNGRGQMLERLSYEVRCRDATGTW